MFGSKMPFLITADTHLLGGLKNQPLGEDKKLGTGKCGKIEPLKELNSLTHQ